MQIIEIIDAKDIGILLSIAESYPRSVEESEAVRKQLMSEIAEAGDNRHIYVGYENEKAVAMVQIVLKNADNDPNLANGKDLAHAHNLQVKEDLQGKGIGKIMMAFIENIARCLGKETFTLGVDDTNERAIQLYKKIGYEVFSIGEGRTPEEKCLLMKKSLR